MLTSPLAILLPVLMTGPTSEEPGPVLCQTGVHHIELPELAPSQPPLVCISPGQTTLINFDGALVPGSLSLEGEDRFTLVEPGASSLKLVPSERLAAGEQLRLTVRFRDTAAPTSATLRLLVHPAQAEALVDVHRQTRPVESYRQELRALAEKNRQLQEENVRLRTESAGPGGLAGLHALNLLEDKAFRATELGESVKVSPASALRLGGPMSSFRAADRVAVKLRLLSPEGAAPWTAQDASLVLERRKGVKLKVLEVWPRSTVLPGKWLTLVVEAEVSDVDSQGPFTLRLWEAEGGRTVVVHGVMLP